MMSNGMILSSIFGKAKEKITQGLRVINTDHGNIHAGEGYTISIEKTGIADNGKSYITLTPPSDEEDKIIHFKFWKVWTNNAKVFLRIYEVESDTITGGTTVTQVNRNRFVKEAGLTVVKNSPTVDLTGALLIETDIYGGGGTTPSSRVGGAGDKDIEYVFDKDKSYVFEFENKSGSSADVLFYAFWYEEEANGDTI